MSNVNRVCDSFHKILQQCETYLLALLWMELNGPHVVLRHHGWKGTTIVGGGYDDGLVIGDDVVGMSEVGKSAVGDVS